VTNRRGDPSDGADVTASKAIPPFRPPVSQTAMATSVVPR